VKLLVVGNEPAVRRKNRMNTRSVMMVQISNRAWTLAALQSACQIARTAHARIALVQMIPVSHPSLLGTDAAYEYFDAQEQCDFAEYQAAIADEGIDCEPLLFQYASLVEATMQAAQHVGASIVFARIPDSPIPFWTKFQTWRLQRGLAARHCRLVQQPEDIIFMPVPVVEAARMPGSR
jgi:hypothetical protein